MKRFLKIYLAVVLITMLLANLILIVIFARDFGFQAVMECPDCRQASQALTTALIITNITLAILFLSIFISIKYLVGRIKG